RRARPPSARGASNAGPVLTARRAPWESEKGKVEKASYAVFPFLLLTFPFPHERHRHAAGAAAAARELVARQLDGDAGAVLDLVVAVAVEEALGAGDVEAVLAEGVERAAGPLVADDEAGADGEEVAAVRPPRALLRQGVGAAAGDERVGAPGHLGQRHLQAREHAHAEAVRPVARLEVEHVVAGLLDDGGEDDARRVVGERE